MMYISFLLLCPAYAGEIILRVGVVPQLSRNLNALARTLDDLILPQECDLTNPKFSSRELRNSANIPFNL